MDVQILKWAIVEQDGSIVAEVCDEDTARLIVRTHKAVYESFAQEDREQLARWCGLVGKGVTFNMPHSCVTKAV